jgi:hypothetical protein
MFRTYVIKLLFRILIFIAALTAYLLKPESYDFLFGQRLFGDIMLVYVVWAIMMMSMLYSFMPSIFVNMGSKKQYTSEYLPDETGYDKVKLSEYIKSSNSTALRVLLLWASINAATAILYFSRIIGPKEIILLCLFYYVCDLVCVVLWCPFQSLFMKNRCCVTCRIYNWDWFMIMSPLIFIPSFLTWSLAFVSIIILIRWEIAFFRHPEMFWDGSNIKLRCSHCSDQLCRIKKPIDKRTDKQTKKKETVSI